jgi:hypothetical protein
MSARTEEVRYEILNQCYGYRPLARDCEAMVKVTKRDGTIASPTVSEFVVEAEYLVGKKFLDREADELNKARIRYKITAAGIDHVEARGLS